MSILRAVIQSLSSEQRGRRWFALMSILILSLLGFVTYTYTSKNRELIPAQPSAGAALESHMQSEAPSDSVVVETQPSVPDSFSRRQAAASTIRQLVHDLCDIKPVRLRADADAYIVRLQGIDVDSSCLDDVALHFDRLHHRELTLTFEFEVDKDIPAKPILHISAVHNGAFPYLHLQGGKTLYVGATFDGWLLTAIDQDGALFEREGEQFRLETSEGSGMR